MKKLFSIILIACLAMAVMAVAPVSAANDEVLYGTPVLDGKVDDIYKSSLTIEYTNDQSKNAATGSPWNTASAKFYALYDASYVYLVADVTDDDVVSAADSFVYENGNPYGNDVVEFRLDFNGGDAMFKIGVDAFGKRAYTGQPDLCDIETVEYVCTQSDTGYVIEVKVPYDTNDRNDVYSAGKLGLKLWLFDLHADYEGIEKPTDKVHFSHYCIDYAGEGAGTPVLYTLSEEKATAPSAGDDKTDDTTAGKTDDKTDDTTAGKTDDKTDDTAAGTPDTFDPAVIAVVLTAASGAAFVVASKKRH